MVKGFSSSAGEMQLARTAKGNKETKHSRQSRAPGDALSVAESMAFSKRTTINRPAIIEAQLKAGVVEVNISSMVREEVKNFVLNLRHAARKLTSLKLKCMPRGAGWSQYQLAEMNDASTAGKAGPYHQPLHLKAVQLASAHAQHHSVRFGLYAVLQEVLSFSPITDLEIGLRLSPSGYQYLARGLAKCTTLKRISFAGSHMGDTRLEPLQGALESSLCLEEVDLTACALSDKGADIMAAVIRAHAQRRVGAGFSASLREYPDTSLGPDAARAAHYATMVAIAQDIDTQCGGLLHLELAENPEISDRGALSLREALAFDRRMILLSLRGCGCTLATEGEFVSLMREHRALARVDLRRNSGKGGNKMGILKLRKESLMPTMTAAGFQFARAASGGPLSPALTMKSAALWEVLEGDATQGGGKLLGIGGAGGGELGPSPWVTPAPSFRSTPSCQSWGDEQLVAFMRNPSVPSPPPPAARPPSVRSPLRRSSLDEQRPPPAGAWAGSHAQHLLPQQPSVPLHTRTSGTGGDDLQPGWDGTDPAAGVEDGPTSPRRRGGLKRHTSATDRGDRSPSPAPAGAPALWSPVPEGGSSGGGAAGRSMSLGRVSFATERSGAGLSMADGSISGAASQAGNAGFRGADAGYGSGKVAVNEDASGRPSSESEEQKPGVASAPVVGGVSGASRKPARRKAQQHRRSKPKQQQQQGYTGDRETDSYIVAQLYDALVQVGQQHQQGSTGAGPSAAGRLQEVLHLVLDRYARPQQAQQAVHDRPPLPPFVDVSTAGVGDMFIPAGAQQLSPGPALMPAVGAAGAARIWGPPGAPDMSPDTQLHVPSAPSSSPGQPYPPAPLLSLDPAQLEAEAAESRTQLAQAVEALRQLEVAVSAAEYKEELRRADEASRQAEQAAAAAAGTHHQPHPPPWQPASAAEGDSWGGGVMGGGSRQGWVGSSRGAHLVAQAGVGFPPAGPVGRVGEVAETLRRWCGICDDVLEEW